MNEKNIKCYIKKFAMWSHLPLPKVSFGDETLVSSNEIIFCMGKESDRDLRLQDTVIYWLILVSQNEKHAAKIVGIFSNALFGVKDGN